MTRNAKKELREIFYDSLINDNNQWIKEMKSDCHGSWIEYKSPRYENMYFIQDYLILEDISKK